MYLNVSGGIPGFTITPVPSKVNPRMPTTTVVLKNLGISAEFSAGGSLDVGYHPGLGPGK
jgi:hypothetical protein